MKSEYRIRVRNRHLKFIGEVESWINLEIQLHMNDVGVWAIEVSVPSETDPKKTSKSAQLFLDIAADPNNSGKAGVYIERNGHFLMSGPLTEIEETCSDSGHTLKVIGSCDLQFIADKMAMPHPRTWSSPYMTVDGTTGTGHSDYMPNKGSTGARRASWHIYAAVRNNIGENGPSGRPPLPFLATRDNSVGYLIPEGEYTIARGENLFQLCKNVADYSDYKQYPIRMTAYQYDTGQKDSDGSPVYKVRFECLAAQNRANVILSPDLGTIGNYTYTRKRPEANTILMGGSGEGKRRLFYYGWDTPSLQAYGTIESFEEYTGIRTGEDGVTWAQERAKLTQEIQAILAEKAEQTTFTFEFRETPMIQYGRDFQIGDRVYIRLRGKETSEVVRFVSFAVSGNEERMDLVVGKQSSIYKGLRLFDDMQKMKFRYSDLTKRTLGE